MRIAYFYLCICFSIGFATEAFGKNTYKQERAVALPLISELLKWLDFEPATDENLYCHIPQKNRYISDYPHADYMLDLAAAAEVVIFVHGFAPHQKGGKHSLKNMAKLWQEHINLVKENKNTAYCVATWDSEFGVDDRNFTLSKFYDALTLSMGYKPIRRFTRAGGIVPRVTLVGHSAGGNYIKYSLNSAKSYQLPSQYSQAGFTQKAYTRILTLATPHLGTKFANDSAMYIILAELYRSLFPNQNLKAIIQHYSSKINSRGARQLGPIASNPVLQKVNTVFAKHFPRNLVYAIGSNNDKFVSLNSATPSFTKSFRLDISHNEFLNPNQNKRLKAALRRFYRGGSL